MDDSQGLARIDPLRRERTSQIGIKKPARVGTRYCVDMISQGYGRGRKDYYRQYESRSDNSSFHLDKMRLSTRAMGVSGYSIHTITNAFGPLVVVDSSTSDVHRKQRLAV